MKAVVVTGENKVEIKTDVPMPVLGEYDCLVKIETCGFCNGTDTRIIAGAMAPVQGMQPFPTVLGHEAAGYVVEIGKKVKNIAVGEKHIRIAGADTKGSPYSSMHGQMAEYGVITDYAAMAGDGLPIPKDAPVKPSKLPDDFDLIDAGVLLPLCECLSAVRNFGIDQNTDVLVYGAGPMGLAMMQYMHILGAKSVTCIDSVEERLKMAREIAMVDQTINFEKQDMDAVLGGRLFDRVVDAVGLSLVVLEASRRLKPYGSVCCLGVLRKDDSRIDLSQLKNNTRLHMLNFPYEEYGVLEENLSYIRQGLLDPKNYYSHVLPMEEVQKAIDLVLSKQTIKVILTI